MNKVTAFTSLPINPNISKKVMETKLETPKEINDNAELNQSQYLNFKGNVNMSTPITPKLAISEKELDEILNTKSTTYVFNPQEAYDELAEGDKKALKHLIKAGKALDSVFLKQDHAKNIEVKKALQKAADAGNTHAAKALQLFNIFNGIEGQSGLDPKPVRLFKDLESDKGKNVYPADLTKEELVSYLKKHIEQAPAILNNDSIVKRKGSRLEAVPYSIAFKKEYEAAAKELLQAAKETTHKDFAKYLRLQAQALISTDPEYTYKADEAWANLKDSPLEFTIGRESYEEGLTGAVAEDKELVDLIEQNGFSIKPKDFISARVGIVDQASTQNLADYKNHLKTLSELMPLKDQYIQSVDTKKPGEETKQTLADVDLVYLGGDYAARRPGLTLAQNLPNDDKLSVQLNAGKRNVFHKQIRQTENPEARQKLLDNLIDSSQHKWYDKEADHLFTVGHELSHSLGPIKTKSGGDKKASLGDGYGDIVEECKADMGSISSVPYFVQIGKYTPEMANKIYLTWAVRQTPLSNPPLNQAHRVREVMQLNYFMEKGAIKLEKGEKLSIVPEKMASTAKQMLEDVIKIQLEGNPAKAKEFVDKYRQWNDKLQYISDVRQNLSPKPFKIIETPLADRILGEK